MITVVVNTMPEFKLGTIGAGSDSRVSLIAIANATVLDRKKLDMKKTRLFVQIVILTDAVDVTMFANWH